jgi:uncharacterized membrane protein
MPVLLPTPPTNREPEPRWQALIALLAVGGLYVALPEALTVGPRWLLPAVVGALVVPLVISNRAGAQRLNVALGVTVTAVVTAAMIASLALLIAALPSHRESPTALLMSAASLWVTNIVVFALWYWRFDAGGPHRRDARQDHTSGSFLFPQMTLLPSLKEARHPRGWAPHFLDYLFLAFNTSTAFSPTDTPVLTRWAKILMMLQSLISLTVLVVLAARAVNIL